jgi:hypothetical protein
LSLFLLLQGDSFDASANITTYHQHENTQNQLFFRIAEIRRRSKTISSDRKVITPKLLIEVETTFKKVSGRKVPSAVKVALPAAIITEIIFGHFAVL